MRIISGEAGSIPLRVPKSLTRPTTDRVREALFSSLGTTIADSSVLDLFAGSGSLGLEALSRGASTATFVDSGKASIEAIEANLKKARLEGGRSILRDVIGFLGSIQPNQYDLIFADPPYARGAESEALLESLLSSEKLPASLTADGMLILESFAPRPIPTTGLWELAKEKKYGKTRISFLTPIR